MALNKALIQMMSRSGSNIRHRVSVTVSQRLCERSMSMWTPPAFKNEPVVSMMAEEPSKETSGTDKRAERLCQGLA